MPIYKVRLINSDGTQQEIQIESQDESTVKQQLIAQNKYVVDIIEQKKAFTLVSACRSYVALFIRVRA